jgi:hypothetical protein
MAGQVRARAAPGLGHLHAVAPQRDLTDVHSEAGEVAVISAVGAPGSNSWTSAFWTAVAATPSTPAPTAVAAFGLGCGPAATPRPGSRPATAAAAAVGWPPRPCPGRRPAAWSTPALRQGRHRSSSPTPIRFPVTGWAARMARLPVTWAVNRPPSPRKLITSALPATTLSRATSSYRRRELSTDGADSRLGGPVRGSRGCRLHRGCSLLVGGPRAHRREG